MEVFCSSDVVWCPVDKGYPLWPCRVVTVDGDSIEVESFGDNFYYKKQLKSLKKFSQETVYLLKKGRHRLKKKSSDLELFNTAIEQAVQELKKKDPEFTLDEDILESSLSQSSTFNSPSSTTSSFPTPESLSRSSKQWQSNTPCSADPKPKRSPTVLSSVNLKHISIDVHTRSPLATSLSILRKGKADNDSSYSSLPPLDGLLSSDCEFTPSRKRSSLFDGGTPALKRVPKQWEDYSLDDLGQQSGYSELESSLESADVTSQPSNKTGGLVQVSGTDPPCLSKGQKSSDESRKFDSPHETVKSLGIATTSSCSHSADEWPSVTGGFRCPDRRSSPYCTVSEKGSLELEDGFVTPPHSLSRDSDSDDDLPSVHFGDDTLKFDALKENDVIWAKFRGYPYWPALVSSMQKRGKSSSSKKANKMRPRVYFLGSADNKPLPISNENNIATFSFKNKETLKQEGYKALEGRAVDLKSFEQAVKEADQLKKLRVEKEIMGSPKQQFEALASRRPKQVSSSFSFSTSKPPKNDDDNDSQRPTASAFGYDIGSTQRDLFGRGDESSSEGEWTEEEEKVGDENSPYRFSKIMEHFESMKSELVKISRGEVVSELHNTFFDGTKIERGQLKLMNKFGPAQSQINRNEQDQLLKFLKEAVKETFDGSLNFQYAFDVLLPEAIVRMMCQVESCNLEEAWKKFSSAQ